MTEPTVSIIVRAKDNRELTGKCLESIRQNTPDPPYQIILVDDGSDPPLFGLPADHYLYNAGPVHGAPRATNMGLSIATFSTAPYALILDNDTEIPTGDVRWLTRMVAELEDGGPRTACVGATSAIVNPPQHILHAPETYVSDWERGFKDNPPVPCFVSFAVLFRKIALVECGLWPEVYGKGQYEDTDYSVTVRLKGWQVRVARSVYIHHHGHRTMGPELQALLNANFKTFVGRWGIGRLYDMDLIDAKIVRQYVEAKERMNG